MVKKILHIVRPRGFCAGVSRAIDIVNLAIDVYGAPIYVLHELVHNGHVVRDLVARGAVFIQDVEQVPPRARLIFSAHGVSPEVRLAAMARHIHAIDATCPLVIKVHLEAVKFARKGYSILLIGDRNHDEVVGTFNEAPEHTKIISTQSDANQVAVTDPSRVVYLTQTTLSVYDTAEIIERLRERFPSIQGPDVDDICYATQNRQEAVESVARRVCLVLVVGSKNSSNSNSLVGVAQRAGTRAYLIEDENGIHPEWVATIESVAITAGASTPETIVQRVRGRLEGWGFVSTEVEALPENVHFKLPTELTVLPVVRAKLAS